MQYFIWKSIKTNRFLANEFKKLTEDPIPDLDFLNDKRDVVIRRYLSNQSEYKQRFSHNNKNKTNKTKAHSATAENSMAANIPQSKYSSNNKAKVWCALCKGLGDNSHKIYQCPRFPTSKDKIERLKSLGGCVKCSYTSHKTQDCTFKFNSKCRHCSSESHYLWLCPQMLTARKGVEGGSDQGVEAVIDDDDSMYGSVMDESECEESEIESVPEDVNVSMCQVTSKALSLPSNAILPTLQAEV